MSIFRKQSVLSLIIISFIIFGCSSFGGVSASGDGVYVTISDQLKNYHADKVQEIRERQFVETLLRYITHRFRKLEVRKGLEFHVSIEKVRLRTSSWSFGGDSMNVDVTVKENGKEIKKFSTGSVTTRSRGSATNAMSKDIAKKMYEQIKGL